MSRALHLLLVLLALFNTGWVEKNKSVKLNEQLQFVQQTIAQRTSSAECGQS